MKKPVVRKLRCAVYTRKSTEEGLDMEFNSLDAQREACEAYVASQKAEGWLLLPDRLDDGGFSGGTLERPALQRLIADIEAGRVDVVVSAHDHIYERLTPMEPSQRADLARGIRLFISGGGGAPPYQRARFSPRSELMISAHGLLRLKLDHALYEWEFIAANGSVLDRGLSICH